VPVACATPSPSRAGAPVVGILSTFRPTPCGLATFSAALAAGLVAHGADVRVVRIADEPSPDDALVVGELRNGSTASAAACVDLLNECDVVLLQHEYGVYGGADGADVVELVAALRVPCIVIAHTALSEPTEHQHRVLAELADLADRVVVMSRAAATRMRTRFGVDPAKVVQIHHGATVPQAAEPDPGRPTFLTCGLVGPGKGIERVIDAMGELRDVRPRPRYLVAGRTHPKVLAAEGERYRNERIEQAWRLGVAGSVSFDDEYRDVPSLTSLLQSSTAVVLPYDSRDQATSGVLVDAIAAGRPVVATAFPHAVELLASGAGLVVPQRDPTALAAALRRVLTQPDLAASMAAEARRLAPGLAWPAIACQYVALSDALLSGSEVLSA
jgi:glycosyltransferase involved in cell wall biosynthesis